MIGEARSEQYTFAPSEQGPVILLQDKRWVGRPMRWGLIPFWADSPQAAGRYSLINARVETIQEKRSYKQPCRHRRCLVPAFGFYEWQPQGKGAKQPNFIKDPEDQLLFFAGVWNEWRPKDQPEAESVYSYSIIVGNPPPEIEVLHDRMPLALSAEMHERWLDPELTEPEELQSLLHEYHHRKFTYYPVSRYVNNPQNEGRQCIEVVK